MKTQCGYMMVVVAVLLAGLVLGGCPQTPPDVPVVNPPTVATGRSDHRVRL